MLQLAEHFWYLITFEENFHAAHSDYVYALIKKKIVGSVLNFGRSDDDMI